MNDFACLRKTYTKQLELDYLRSRRGRECRNIEVWQLWVCDLVDVKCHLKKKKRFVKRPEETISVGLYAYISFFCFLP